MATTASPAHEAYHAYRESSAQTVAPWKDLSAAQQALWNPLPASASPGQIAYHTWRAENGDASVPGWKHLTAAQKAMWQAGTETPESATGTSLGSDPFLQSLLANQQQSPSSLGTPAYAQPVYIGSADPSSSDGTDIPDASGTTASNNAGFFSSLVTVFQTHLTAIAVIGTIAVVGFLAYKGKFGARAEHLIKGIL